MKTKRNISLLSGAPVIGVGASTLCRTLALGMLAVPLAAAGAQAQITVLHSFTGGTGGTGGYGGLIQSGNTFYGMGTGGGSSNGGTVFSINADGLGYQVLGSFNGTDGKTPRGALILGDTTGSTSTLYGMTEEGGANGDGTVFSIPVAGGTPTDLHNFAGGASDGSSPQYGSLLQSGNTLYGLTYQGGSAGDGTVFSISITGGATTVLHAFTGSGGDGSQPFNSLVESGGELYGTTQLGGTGGGTVFSILPSGGTPSTLSDSVAYEPQSTLTVSASGTSLYGMAQFSGANGAGSIFSIPIGGGAGTGVTPIVGDQAARCVQ